MQDTLRPQSAEALAEALRSASEEARVLVPWGAGTLQHFGTPPPPHALRLSTSAIERIVEYSPPDLTVTVEAGMALGHLQETLRKNGQYLPWEPPAPAHATIGGLLAAGVSGPLRLGCGTPRDWVLGLRVALGDGRLVKSGGKVVKNVAGYEAHKLHIGALGTLGVIVEATFKLAPLPEQVGSLVLACRSAQEAVQRAEQLRTPPLAPVSLILLSPAAQLPRAPINQDAHWRVVVRFAGVEAAVQRQLDHSRALLPDGEWRSLDQEQSQSLWNAIALFSAPTNELDTPGLTLRAGVAPAALPLLLDALDRHAAVQPVELLGYAGVGLVYARWPLPPDADPARLRRSLADLRAQLAGQGGYAVVEQMPDWLRSQLDAWGTPPETLPLMRALKQQWDPQGVLNPGRYVGAF